MLLWDILVAITETILIAIDDTFLNGYYKSVFLGTALTLFLAGFFGDFLLSRYKLALFGLYTSFLLLISLMMVVALALQPSSLVLVLSSLSLIVLGVVRVSLLSFNIDQLIGSSSDELTAIIHWHNIGPQIAIFLMTVILFETKPSLQLIILFFVCVTFVAFILVSHSLFNQYLDITPVNTTNPVKLIVKVLDYARKHKCPENRSALTYWEENAPSRLDLGKEKYGGPFMEEEVEDVKTIIRLIPLLVVSVVPSALYGEYSEGMSSNLYGCHDSSEGQIVLAVTYIIIIVLLQFFVYPCLHNYIPSMLKWIGLGLALILVINIASTVLAVIGNQSFGQIFHCLTAFDEESYETEHFWIIGYDAILAANWYTTNVVLVQFLLAQCPKSMRGTVIGLFFCIRLLRSWINFVLFLPFLYFIGPNFSMGRGFYFLLTQAVLALFFFILFLFLAKRYKFRVREVEINIHQIAENHTINDIEHEELEDEERRRRFGSLTDSSTLSQYLSTDN